MVDFAERLLGLRRVHEEPGIVVFAAPNGDTLEVFTADEPDHIHFTTGPVVGFLVDDVAAARQELEEAGIALLGPVHRGGGMVWQHFRGPDGNVWEVTGRTEE
ncbi:MAG: VOC family protein [Actinomycetota bacterium]|nr:VOC family protein [Actinomycetota bacterium]